ncbi:MAG: ice-binding family protein [Phycisphaerae bacterium]|nr:ice-binding family protein [Phycisphaerae bacterium]
MKRTAVCLVAACAAIAFVARTSGDFLGSAQNFGVLGGSTVTNTGASVINGDLGLWPGTAVTGFPPGIVNGVQHINNGVAQQAQADALTAYNVFAGMSFGQNLSGMDLGGLTLTPGVYFFSSSAQLSAALTLDGLGDPNALFVFQIASTLTTASASSILNINGADGCNIYWQVGSAATLGTETQFQGNILANTSITLNTGANILDGRAFALNGAVTMDTNIINAGCVIPMPGATLLLAGAIGGRRNRASRRGVH